MRGARPLAIAGGAIAALIVAEVAVGVVAPSFDPRQQIHFVDIDGHVPIGEPNTVTRQIKNTGDYDVTVRINKYGFRDAKDIADAGPNDYVLVGDSFAFGWGVEEGERLSDLLESRLNARVFNIAVTGNFDTYQDLLDYAAAQGANIRKVIVCVAMESDLQRYEAAPSLASSPAMPVPTSHRVLEMKQWLLSHLGLYFTATSAIHHVPWLDTLAVRAHLIVPNLEGLRRQAFDPEIVESSAQRLARLARRYETTIVLLPSRALWHGEAQADESRTHEEFAARLRALSLDVVDLRPAFEQGGKPLQYHFHGDPHWNKRGHALAANVAAAHVAKRH